VFVLTPAAGIPLATNLLVFAKKMSSDFASETTLEKTYSISPGTLELPGTRQIAATKRGKSDQECEHPLIVFTASPAFTLEPLSNRSCFRALRPSLGISGILKMKTLYFLSFESP